jgi:plastocyanin
MSSQFARLSIASVALAVLTFAVACGGSGYPSNPTSPTPNPTTPNPPVMADVTITILGMNGSSSFSPNPATVKAGQTVAWQNSDSVTHLLVADASGGFNAGSIAPGATSTPIVMSAAGTVGYHCSIHPSMIGTLTINP